MRVLFASFLFFTVNCAVADTCHQVFSNKTALQGLWVHLKASEITLKDIDIPGLFLIRTRIFGQTIELEGYFSGNLRIQDEKWFLENRFPPSSQISKYTFSGVIVINSLGEPEVHIDRIRLTRPEV